jgi:hypothetical protein
MLLGEVLLLAGLGLAISIPAALVGSKLVKSLLYQTEPHDPLTMAVAAVSLVVAAILAGYLLARSAAKIDPMSALRHVRALTGTPDTALAPDMWAFIPLPIGSGLRWPRKLACPALIK